MNNLKKYLRKLFGKCAYCGEPLTDSGGNKSSGTPHKVYKSNKHGWPTNKEVIQHACFKCEMEFDDA